MAQDFEVMDFTIYEAEVKYVSLRSYHGIEEYFTFMMGFSSKKRMSGDKFTCLLEERVKDAPREMDKEELQMHLSEGMIRHGIEHIGVLGESPISAEGEMPVYAPQGITLPEYLDARSYEGYPDYKIISFYPDRFVRATRIIEYLRKQQGVGEHITSLVMGLPLAIGMTLKKCLTRNKRFHFD